MSPQRRTALVSVFAAIALIALKLGTGIATGSLGLLSEAAHSGTDLVAALLTFFAVGVAVRPADPGHQYGHGKAEHLSALALYHHELNNSMGTQMYVLMCVAFPVIGLVMGAVGVAGTRPRAPEPLYLDLDG